MAHTPIRVGSRRYPLRLIGLTCVAFCGLLSVAGDPATTPNSSLPPAVDRPVDFVRDVEPLLKAHCHHCHGDDEQQARLRLDARAITLTGGISGPSIVPGNSAESLLVQRIVGHAVGPQMPSDMIPSLSATIIACSRTSIIHPTNRARRLDQAAPPWQALRSGLPAPRRL